MKIFLVISATIIAIVTAAVIILHVHTDVPDLNLKRPRDIYTSPFPQKDIRVDGMRLRYVDVGHGPPVILIPGHMSRLEEMDGLTAVLREDFRVLVFDFPGTGYSDKPERRYGLKFYEDTLIGFLDEIRVEKCYLAGGSLGGNLALRLAHRDPKRFPRIVAWAPGSAWPAKPILGKLMRIIGGRATFWPTYTGQSMFWFSDDYPHREENLRQNKMYLDEVLSPGFIAMYWGMAADQVGWSLTEIAADIRTPTLLMWGDQDHGMGMNIGIHEVHRLMPHSELAVFPGAGHSLSSERPEEVNERVREFLLRPKEKLP